MTRAAAKSSLRSPGAPRRARVPNEPRADAPKPTPATTVPAPASTTLWASTPASVEAVPPESRIALIPKTLLMGQFRSAKAVRAPAPHSRVTTRPPMRWLLRPKRLAAAERPAGKEDRDEGKDVRAKAGRNGDQGYQRGHGARASCRRLRHAGDDHAPKDHSGQQDGKDKVCRARCVLHERAAANRSYRQAADWRHSVDEAGAAGRVRWVHIDEGGSERRKRRSGRDALRHARDHQDRDITCDEEQNECHSLERDRPGKHGAATDVIGKTTENEQ